MLLVPCYFIIKSIQAKYWIPMQAEIELVDLKARKTEDTKHKTIFQYIYFIENKKYIGNKIIFGSGQTDIEEDYELFKTLKEAKKIIVYVNPYNYSESIVVKNLDSNFRRLLIGSFFWNSIVAVFLIPVFFKYVKEENPLFIIDNNEDPDYSF